MPRLSTETSDFEKKPKIFYGFYTNQSNIDKTTDYKSYNFLMKTTISMDLMYSAYGAVKRENKIPYIENVVYSKNKDEFVVKFTFNKDGNVKMFKRLMLEKLREYGRPIHRSLHGYVDVDFIGPV